MKNPLIWISITLALFSYSCPVGLAQTLPPSKPATQTQKFNPIVTHQDFAQQMYDSINVAKPRVMVSEVSELLSDTFPKRSHDFQASPSFGKKNVTFEFANVFDFPLRLQGTRSSCGCAKPRIVTRNVMPGQTGKVDVELDTKRFRGQKKSTVTIGFEQPFAEVQVKINSLIRQDIVLKPGSINFDNTIKGEPTARAAQILYAGNPAWRIKEVWLPYQNMTASYKLLPNDDPKRVDYEVVFRYLGHGSLPSKLHAIIITNDRNPEARKVAIPINVKMFDSAIQTSPVRLGNIKTGQKVKRKLIVRGKEPFKINRITAGDSRIEFEEEPTGYKTLHILSYKVDTANPGKIMSKVTIEPSEGNEAVIDFSADITDQLELDDSKTRKNELRKRLGVDTQTG